MLEGMRGRGRKIQEPRVHRAGYRRSGWRHTSWGPQGRLEVGHSPPFHSRACWESLGGKWSWCIDCWSSRPKGKGEMSWEMGKKENGSCSEYIIQLHSANYQQTGGRIRGCGKDTRTGWERDRKWLTWMEEARKQVFPVFWIPARPLLMSCWSKGSDIGKSDVKKSLNN